MYSMPTSQHIKNLSNTEIFIYFASIVLLLISNWFQIDVKIITTSQAKANSALIDTIAATQSKTNKILLGTMFSANIFLF